MDELPEAVALTPTSFRTDHRTADAEAELASLVFVLDLQAANPAVRRLRAWARDELAARPGDTAVDVGAGTGEEVQALASLVWPTGRAVGVEPHAGLRAEAQRRAAGTSATYVDGDARALPFEDGSVDVLRCERVWQHLVDPQEAADEVARVLAPGGRVAVLDTDWSTVVGRAGDPDVQRRLNESTWRRMANPFAGRHLRAQLQRAGLTVRADIGSSALVMPDEVMASPMMVDLDLRLGVEEGVVSQDEADAYRQAVVEAAQRGEGFMAVTMFAVVGDKPGSG
ncbi:methyltransferase domain-containing protein [Nocardioides sp. HDW12B]|uniref:methyltransferase domain-containing protein n=1 Tax=Nocardioides sp. HDW12B TaxID=2714939 RepID=UPI0014078E33|nr:methyltransferase domain-containing protein [Nocardioides sp. HDW12B]QIK65004.1 methyltransferase domain-containing protein [Nocardioides sp. HDW12B]